MGFIFGVVDRKHKCWPFDEEIYTLIKRMHISICRVKYSSVRDGHVFHKLISVALSKSETQK